MGSAANALIDRLPKKISWVKGRSVCDKCGHVLQWYDLIPIISYLSLLRFNTPHQPPSKFSPSASGFAVGGREKGGIYAGCRYCRSPIAPRNLITELLMGIGFLVIFNFQFSIFNQFSIFKLLILLGIFWVTVIIAVMDWETMLVSEVMVAVWAGLVIMGNWGNWGNMGNWAGLMIGIGLIGGIWLMSRGRAMGAGDIEIAAVMGWWLGWPKITVALWMAFILGSVVGVYRLAKKKSTLKSEIAFGPFLIIGSWAALVWGDKIWSFLGI